MILGLPGCRCAEEKPYTPFAVTTQLPEEGTPPEEVAPPDETARELPAVHKAPPQTSLWTLAGQAWRAPTGTHFQTALLLQEGDAPPTLLAWVTGAHLQNTPTGLWLFDATGHPREQLLSPPSFLPQGKDCEEIVQVLPIGLQTLSIEIERRCQERLLPGTPERALLILDRASPTRPLLTLRLAELPPGESLRLTSQAEDQDADGREDLRIHLELTSPQQIKEALEFSWLRRPAGLSRQKESPASALQKRAERLVLAGQRKAERAQVPAQVDTLRRLFSAVCAESGTAKVSQEDGVPLSCGTSVPSSIARLVTAQVHAYLGLKQPRQALGELERADWYGTAPSEKDLTTLQKLVLAAIPSGPAQRVAQLPSSLGAHPPGVLMNRLQFDAEGVLWEQTEDEPRPVWPTRTTLDPEEPVPTPPPPFWPEPASPSGKQAQFVLPSCDRSEVQLTWLSAKTPLPAPSPLALLAPRPGSCQSFGGQPLVAQWAAWVGEQALVFVGGELFSTNGQSVQQLPGAPRAFPTRLGLSIHAGAELELWQTDSPLAQASSCALSPNREHVACLEQRSLSIWKRPAELKQ